MSSRTVSLRSVAGFRTYAGARLVSLAGSAVSWLALPVAMYQLTGSALWTAAVAAGEALPYLLFGLLAGAFADRSSPLPLMIRADVLSALMLLSVPVAHLFDVLHPVNILLAGMGVQTAFVFYDAANFGFLPALVGRDLILPANSLLYSLESGAQAVVPAAAGAVLAVVAAPLLITVDALSFVASAVLLSRVRAAATTPDRPAMRPAASLAAGILEGLHYLLTHRAVGASTCVSTMLTVSNGGVMALLVVWSLQSFGITQADPRLGLLYAAVAVGGVLAGVVGHGVAACLSAAAALRLLTPLAAAAAYLMLTATRWWQAALLLVAAQALSTGGVITAVSLRQQLIPPELQSRVNTTARMIAFGGGFALGATLAGSLSTQLGPTTALRVVFSSVLLAILLAWVAVPSSPLGGGTAPPAPGTS